MREHDAWNYGRSEHDGGHSFIAQACLHIDRPDRSILSRRDGLIAVLTEWCQKGDHAIVIRNLRRAASRDGAGPVNTGLEDA
jgi:hypothetical protein